MSALRWEQPHNDLGPAESLSLQTGPAADPRLATIEDDDPARGIVLGVAVSLIGFWLPLATVLVFRWAR